MWHALHACFAGPSLNATILAPSQSIISTALHQICCRGNMLHAHSGLPLHLHLHIMSVCRQTVTWSLPDALTEQPTDPNRRACNRPIKPAPCKHQWQLPAACTHQGPYTRLPAGVVACIADQDTDWWPVRHGQPQGVSRVCGSGLPSRTCPWHWGQALESHRGETLSGQHWWAGSDLPLP